MLRINETICDKIIKSLRLPLQRPEAFALRIAIFARIVSSRDCSRSGIEPDFVRLVHFANGRAAGLMKLLCVFIYSITYKYLFWTFEDVQNGFISQV